MQPKLQPPPALLASDLKDERLTPATFVAALTAVPPHDRDAWLDTLLDVDAFPPDEPRLPHGCVPYLPCPVATVLEAVQRVGVTEADTFVDVGSGTGRAAALVHLATGAACIGLELQPALARAAQGRADWLGLPRLRFVAGDAADTIRFMTLGTVFFLYCPFGGARLRRFLDGLEDVARARPIRVACVDMAPLERPWLVRLASSSASIDVYRSVSLDLTAAPVGR